MQVYRKASQARCPFLRGTLSVNRRPHLCCRISWLLAVAADNPDFVALNSLTRVLHLERNILDQERPNFVAEPVGIEMALDDVSPVCPSPKMCPYTLKVKRAFTVLSKTSAMLLSKFARIFMASCGSMRLSLMRSSRVSVSAMPMLRA